MRKQILKDAISILIITATASGILSGCSNAVETSGTVSERAYPAIPVPFKQETAEGEKGDSELADLITGAIWQEGFEQFSHTNGYYTNVSELDLELFTENDEILDELSLKVEKDGTPIEDIDLVRLRGGDRIGWAIFGLPTEDSLREYLESGAYKVTVLDTEEKIVWSGTAHIENDGSMCPAVFTPGEDVKVGEQNDPQGLYHDYAGMTYLYSGYGYDKEAVSSGWSEPEGEFSDAPKEISYTFRSSDKIDDIKCYVYYAFNSDSMMAVFEKDLLECQEQETDGVYTYTFTEKVENTNWYGDPEVRDGYYGIMITAEDDSVLVAESVCLVGVAEHPGMIA